MTFIAAQDGQPHERFEHEWQAAQRAQEMAGGRGRQRMTECRCGRPTRDDAYVCDHCLDQLNQALGDTPWLDEQLNITLTGQQGTDYRRGGGSRSAEVRIPVHLAASGALANLRSTLVAWVRFCAEENVRNQSPSHTLPADNIPAMSRWLMWRVDGLGLLDIGPEAVTEITKAVSDGKRIIDRPADKWYAGPCDDETCAADLYARAQTGMVTCAACGLSYDIAERRSWLLEAAEDRLASAADLSRAVSWLGTAPLTAERVRQWASRDRIFAKGHDGKSPLYRVGDAIDLMAESGSKAGAN